MNAPDLPPLPATRGAYLATLLMMVIGFYALLLTSLALTGYALYRLVLWTPAFLSEVHGAGALKVLLIAYAAVGVFGWAILKGMLARVGGDPPGKKLDREHHPRVFALVDEVAARVQADPIHEVFLTAEDEVGVWEEAALYLPPGLSKRKIVLGMGALSYLTLDQLRSILAHEYGHFSHRDTYFSRFIYRVMSSYAAVLRELRDKSGKIQYLNPLYWALKGYTLLYELIAAKFSRAREYHADRFAVESYGRDEFAGVLVAAHVEGAFFSQVGIRRVVSLATEGKGFKNLYHYVGTTRQQFDRDNPNGTAEALGAMLAARTGAFHSHPSLRDRLERQGVRADRTLLPPPPRPLPNPDLDAGAGADGDGPRDAQTTPRPSAAEDLFGDDALALQRELSELCGARYVYMIEAARRAQAGKD